MRCRAAGRRATQRALELTALAAMVFLLVGCGRAGEVIIPAEPTERGGTDLGLGPSVRPLTTGPGDKGSPRWSPSGVRISFIMDGYVVDKPTDASYLRRRTTRDFGAQEIEWVSSGDALAILSADLSETPAAASPVADGTSRAIYRTRPGEESLSVDEISTGALAMSPLPDGGLLIAREEGASTSELATMDDSGQVSRTYLHPVEGKVSGLSVSPDGNTAVLATRAEGTEGSGRFGILGFDLSEGTSWRIADLPEDEEVFGAPQWTGHGVFYVAGEAKTAESGAAASYDVYRLPLDSGKPGPAPGVGEDFVASSLHASPDGERLAIVGRRNPNSPTDLYVLDLTTNVLQAVTANENMEIKTSPNDLAWSADGDHIAIVARGILSGSRVYQVRAEALLADFYNVYDVPVGDSG
ncbi:MAG: hypothetical protein ACR2JR_06145 [Rubrobacteraceae bacterium]